MTAGEDEFLELQITRIKTKHKILGETGSDWAVWFVCHVDSKSRKKGGSQAKMSEAAAKLKSQGLDPTKSSPPKKSG